MSFCIKRRVSKGDIGRRIPSDETPLTRFVSACSFVLSSDHRLCALMWSVANPSDTKQLRIVSFMIRTFPLLLAQRNPSGSLFTVSISERREMLFV